MQTLTAPPRDNLTVAQVQQLLRGPALDVRAGLEQLAPDLSVVADLTDSLESGSLHRQMYANIHGTASLRLTTALPWGTALVRPYQVLTGSGVTARFDLGAYSLTTPDTISDETPTVYDVTGYDRLYLLAREVGDTWEAPAGAGVLAEVRRAITAAGLSGVQLDSTAEALTLPTAMVWPLVPDTGGGEGGPATWLRVVNDLLASVSYRGLWADERGYFRSGPYRDASTQQPGWTFDTSDGARTIMGTKRTRTYDLWRQPNRWVFVQSNRPAGSAPPSTGAGLYVVTNQSNGPASIDLRGMTWTRTVMVDAADQASLQARGDRIAADDQRTITTYKVTTGPFPLAWHFDVFAYTDPELGAAAVKVQAAEWSYDLAGGDVDWRWEQVA